MEIVDPHQWVKAVQFFLLAKVLGVLDQGFELLRGRRISRMFCVCWKFVQMLQICGICFG